jgi:hypothetical protein
MLQTNSSPSLNVTFRLTLFLLHSHTQAMYFVKFEVFLRVNSLIHKHPQVMLLSTLIIQWYLSLLHKSYGSKHEQSKDLIELSEEHAGGYVLTSWNFARGYCFCLIINEYHINNNHSALLDFSPDIEISVASSFLKLQHCPYVYLVYSMSSHDCARLHPIF